MEEKRRDGGTLATAGNPGDSPASEPTSTRRRPGAPKRKASAVMASNSSSTPSKRMTREKAMLVSMSPVHNGPLTRARQAPSNVASSAPAVAAEVKKELVNAATAADVEKPKEEEEFNKAIREWEALEAKIDVELEAIRSRDSNAHVVPNHCGWFSWQKIHPLEERSLPSFFNGKYDGRNPEVYMEIRNWITRKFHSNPNTQIELKDLSELEAGDLDAKQEVMEFLDYWGLINFHPFPQADRSSTSVDDDKVDKGSLIDNLYHFQAVEACPAFVNKPHLTAQSTPARLFPESIVADDLLKQEGPSVEYHCNSCSADCSRKRYHCPKQADFDLCTECFNSGKFGSDMSSSDFILMEPAEAPGVGGGKWTDQETLLLLEALELFKENWNEIAEHVATKTRAQCMLHFLQMPIEDAFFEQIDDKGPSSKDTVDLSAAMAKDDKSVQKEAPASAEDKNGVSEGETMTSVEIVKPEDEKEGKVSQGSSENGDAGDEANQVKVDKKTSKVNNINDVKCEDESRKNTALKALNEAFEDIGYPLTPETTLSFADLGNPVMGLAAFLVRLVGSDIATASACASLKSIDGSSPGLWLATRHCFLLEDPPDNKKDSTASESADTEANQDNAYKVEELEEGRQKDPSSVVEGEELSNTDRSKELLVSVSGEKHPGSESDGSAMKMDSPREERTSEDVKADDSGKPKDIDLSQEKSSEKEHSQDEGSSRDVNKHSRENKGHCQVTFSQSAGDASQAVEASKGMEVGNSLASEKEPENSIQIGKEVQLAKEGMKDAPVTAHASVSQQPIESASVPEHRSAGDDPNPESKREKHVSEGTKDEHNIEKLKQAGVSTLSAAAVKARLLAKQEEDQIRQLSISLIEKQLHKLEMKLTFFNEMENVTTRVRDQLERSRQRLYHERAQIIAARLGVPPSSSSKASLPTNRIATNFAHTVPRPPMGMAYSRPPTQMTMLRPTGGTLASAPNPLASMTGTSAQPSGPDKVS